MPFLLVNIKAAVIQQDIVIFAAQDSREYCKGVWQFMEALILFELLKIQRSIVREFVG